MFHKPEPTTKAQKQGVIDDAMGVKKPKGKFSHIHISRAKNGVVVRHSLQGGNSHNEVGAEEENVFQHSNQAAKHIMSLMGADKDGDESAD